MKTIRTLASFALAVTLFGCMSQHKQQVGESKSNSPGLTKVNQTAEPSNNVTNPKNAREISAHLTTLASQVHGVSRATAVALGPYAVVGINVDPKLDDTRVGSIKYAVAESLKNDPYGKNAIVTANPAIVQRLRGIGTEIRQGRPISGIMNELASIVGRLMPQVPQQTNRRPSNPTDSNNSQLSNNQKHQLKQQQTKQGKAD